MNGKKRRDVGGNRLEQEMPQKIRRTNDDRSADATKIAAQVLKDGESLRPKSRKELRDAKKALKKEAVKAAAQTFTLSEEDQREEKIRLRKENRKELLQEHERLRLRELRKEKKIRKQKKVNRLKNSPGGAHAAQARKILKKKQEDNVNKSEKGKKSSQDTDITMDVFNKVFNGSNDDNTGDTTLRLGVKYVDVIVGKGPMVEHLSMVTVKYKLTGGKFGAIIDSSNKFTFRLGKGEVIQGWDIGLLGMREGGRRQLVVPPKAGYGSKDIGAGAGATLFFDISLLSC